MSRDRLRIGTSGWHYEHWKGAFYPPDYPGRRFLRYYAERFDTVEINSSFYRLPGKETLKKWYGETPADFIFCLKASRLITHMKKLKEPHRFLPSLLEVVQHLGEKLGPILFQLPPRWKPDLDRFGEFLDALPRRFRYAFEFRDRSWFDPAVLSALREDGSAFCIYDFDGRQSPEEVTADFVYVRLHGPKEAYRGRYGPDGLSWWAGALSMWVHRGLDVFCYFDNDEAGNAVYDALELKSMFGR